MERESLEWIAKRESDESAGDALTARQAAMVEASFVSHGNRTLSLVEGKLLIL